LKIALEDDRNICWFNRDNKNRDAVIATSSLRCLGVYIPPALTTRAHSRKALRRTFGGILPSVRVSALYCAAHTGAALYCPASLLCGGGL
jgi:hypothetical protein